MDTPTFMPAAASYSPVMGAQSDAGMVDQMAGGIASRNNAAASQAIGGAKRMAGGDTTSPAFQFTSTMAKTGAAGQTGNTIAGLKFQAAESAAQRNLQSQEANQSAQLSAQNIANQFQNQSVTNQLAAVKGTMWGGGLDSQAAQTAMGITGITPPAANNFLRTGVL